MPSFLALVLWLFCLSALLFFDPANDARLSPASWVTVIWLFIAGTRLPSQWIGGAGSMSAAALEDGNPVDRMIFIVLILLSIGILVSRSFKWGGFFASNWALTAFLALALVSAVWSDFPLIAIKRWIRDFGTYLIVLVVLSDPRPLEAVRAVLRRLGYLLVPLSIMLDKYFPEVSKQYDPWTGIGYYAGASTSKNMLGLLCLVSGLFFFWDIVTRWRDKKQKRTKRILWIDAAFFGMTVWLLHTAESTTSYVCLAMGCMVLLLAHSRIYRRYPRLVQILIPSLFCLYLILDFGLGMNGSLAQAVGKNATLSDRTKIWAFLLSMHTNPVIGTGYQSFWLGWRLLYVWTESGLGHLNEAHNGYLEVYLEEGMVGVAVLAVFLGQSYYGICKRLKRSSSLAVLGMAVWIAFLFYNMSEAAFESGLFYAMFLLGAVTVPASKKQVREAALAGGKAKKAPVPAPALAGESASARATHARSMQWMAHGNPPEIGTRS
jgi:exopolysaccharide production protein ExoQ